MQTIRSFIAVDLPAEIKAKITNQIAGFKKLVSNSSVRWVEAGNLHLTLKFLGEVPLAKISGIEPALKAALQPVPAFDLAITGAGLFPTARKPRVIWLGIHPAGALISLARVVDETMHGLGFDLEERPFSPHLTIGRVNRDVPEHELPRIGEIILKNQPGEIGGIQVQSVTLYRSDLRPQGPLYTPLARVELAGGKTVIPC
jgi:2'-5' RNA ligase